MKLYDLIASQWLKNKQSMGCSGFSRPPQLASRRCFIFESCIFDDVCLLFFQYNALSFCFEFHASFHSHLFARQELN